MVVSGFVEHMENRAFVDIKDICLNIMIEVEIQLESESTWRLGTPLTWRTVGLDGFKCGMRVARFFVEVSTAEKV